LTAAATGLTGATSPAFTISAGTASQLVFTGPPSSAVAGRAIAPAVQVSAKDALGNVVPSFTASVTVALGTNPAGGTLAGATTVTAVAGVATFSTLSVDKTGTGYTLAAVATGLTSATSPGFAITAGPASQLVFTRQPTTTAAGAVITPAVQVSARDALGNLATGFTGSMTVAVGTNPGGGTLAGTTTVTAVAGVATFANLSLNKAGTGYTLTATATGLSGTTSAAFTISAGAASQLVFTAPPSTAVAGHTITPAIQVSARDAQGNPVPGYTGSVTVAVGTNPAGGTLAGTTTVAAVGGVATFSALSLDKAGTGYTLTAAATGLTGATSPAFTINAGAASQLVFTGPPSTAVAGHAIAPAVQVSARDALGNLVTGFTGSMTVGLGTNPAGGTLAGTTTATAVNGVATFATLSIDKVGTGYTLTAAASGLTGATSPGFAITGGPASQLLFTMQPTTTVAGAAITPAVQVSARDALGNLATGFTGSMTVAIGTNPGGGTLAGTTTVTAVAGVATFANLSVNRAGTGYTLTAAASGLTGTSSAAFDVVAGTATQLTFTVAPTATVAGAAITPAVQVSAKDAQGNLVTGFTGSVTVAIGTNPAGGTLAGTTTVTAVGGVATFASLSLDKSGTGYTLTAAAAGLTGATSAAFTINPGAVSQLVFTGPPSSVRAGHAIFPAVQVSARDALGNPVTGYTGSVTVAIGTNPAAGTLTGTTTVTAAAGVATFSTLSIDKVGTGYTLTAAASGLTGATSTAFDVLP
jgi:hypothetical protein